MSKLVVVLEVTIIRREENKKWVAHARDKMNKSISIKSDQSETLGEAMMDLASKIASLKFT